MAGETIRAEAVCLDIRPWSRTSHVVTWLTPSGKIATVVKGAVRPKSAFLGQYDLNYTCDILYYARAKGDLHALRDCAPVDRRDALRGDYRTLALAGYFRRLVSDLAPAGPDCAAWYGHLASSIAGLSLRPAPSSLIARLVSFELGVLELAGLKPDFSRFDPAAEWMPFSVETGVLGSDEGRTIRLSRATAACLRAPMRPTENFQTPLDAARAVGVFYQFHLDSASDVRRTVLRMISQTKEEKR